MATTDRDTAERLRLIEIDGGIRREDDGARVHLTLREGVHLRRVLAEVVLDAEQFMTLARGGTVYVNGTGPREFDGGDALLDALDLVTSPDGKPTGRSVAEIRDDLIALTSATRTRIPFEGTQALHRAMRGTTPRKVPTDD